MQKAAKKTKRGKRKTQEYNNPFDSPFFWVTIATTDFGVFKNERNTEKDPISPEN